MSRRNNRQARGRNAMQALNAYKREMHGHENRLRALDAPGVNVRPYYTLKVHIVLQSDTPGTSFQLRVSDIVKAACNQLGLQPQTNVIFNVKIQRFDAWATSTDATVDRPSVNADISSLIATNGDPTTPGNAVVFYPVIKKLTDTGSQSKSARVSYSWPLSQRDFVCNENANFTVVNVGTNVKTLDTYFIVQFSTTDVAVPA